MCCHQDEFYSEDGDDDDCEEYQLCDAAGQVAVVLSFTGLEDYYAEGYEYFIVTVQPGRSQGLGGMRRGCS